MIIEPYKNKRVLFLFDTTSEKMGIARFERQVKRLLFYEFSIEGKRGKAIIIRRKTILQPEDEGENKGENILFFNSFFFPISGLEDEGGQWRMKLWLIKKNKILIPDYEQIYKEIDKYEKRKN